MSERTVLAVSGSERESFLQGLVSNDVKKLTDGLVYAALLTAQGKFLIDFFMKSEDDRILIDVASGYASDLLKRLNMYRLRADVLIEMTDINVAKGTGECPNGALKDPRHDALGWRGYGEKFASDDTDWNAIRVAHAIPETGLELIPNASFILELGFEKLNGVDFRKGCYVGQEVTARMKHKTELRKGLARVKVDGDVKSGDEISKDGKPVGQIFTHSNGEALAYLRFDRAGEKMQAGDAVVSILPGTS